MKAKKGNRAYTISEAEAKHFQAQGYDIFDDEGKLVQYGAGKTISMEKYHALQIENAKLRDQIDKLAEKLEKAKAKKEK